MAWFADGSAFEDFPGSTGVGFVAIGWLSPEHQYPRKEISENFFRALCGLLHNRWIPPIASPGSHSCEICQFSGGAQNYRFEGIEFSATSSGELFVPFTGGVFIAPLSIAHYIDGHQYCPPEEFQNAVIRCPKMRSPAYLKAILDGGVREWTRQLEELDENLNSQ